MGSGCKLDGLPSEVRILHHTHNGLVAQPDRALPCQGRSCESETRPDRLLLTDSVIGNTSDLDSGIVGSNPALSAL